MDSLLLKQEIEALFLESDRNKCSQKNSFQMVRRTSYDNVFIPQQDVSSVPVDITIDSLSLLAFKTYS